MVKKLAILVPEDCCLVVDSYFSSHAVASGTPFGMLAKRDAAGVAALNRGSSPHSMRQFVRKGGPYGIYVCKNPKVGRKASRVVPFFSNVSVPNELHIHKGGHLLSPLVHMY